MKPKIYVAGPMTGIPVQEVIDRYQFTRDKLFSWYDVLHPMIDHKCFEAHCDDRQGIPACAAPHIEKSFFGRDKWMVQQADIVFADLTDAKQISIGTTMELAWAHMLGKYTITVLPPGNCHDHAFIHQASVTIFPDTDAAILYLQKLADRRF
jgi:nucleoside 2-deoxyribosyltransferase